MKRTILAILLITLVFTSQVFATSSMVVGTVLNYPSSDSPSVIVVPITMTAHTDGTFTAKQLTNAELGRSYSTQGYYLLHAWAVNNGTTYPASGALTITDSKSQQIVGTTVGDTLTFSTAASGVGYLISTRGPFQRPIVGLLTLSTTTTTTNGAITVLYLVFGK